MSIVLKLVLNLISDQPFTTGDTDTNALGNSQVHNRHVSTDDVAASATAAKKTATSEFDYI